MTFLKRIGSAWLLLALSMGAVAAPTELIGFVFDYQAPLDAGVPDPASLALAFLGGALALVKLRKYHR